MTYAIDVPGERYAASAIRPSSSMDVVAALHLCASCLDHLHWQVVRRYRPCVVTSFRRKSMDHRTGDPNRRVPTRDEIARRAHERFVQRGGLHGEDVDDWLQAER